MPLLALLWFAVLHPLGCMPSVRLQVAAEGRAVALATVGVVEITTASLPAREEIRWNWTGASSVLRRGMPYRADEAPRVAQLLTGFAAARRDVSWEHGAGPGALPSVLGPTHWAGRAAAAQAWMRRQAHVVASGADFLAYYPTAPPLQG